MRRPRRASGTSDYSEETAYCCSRPVAASRRVGLVLHRVLFALEPTQQLLGSAMAAIPAPDRPHLVALEDESIARAI